MLCETSSARKCHIEFGRFYESKSRVRNEIDSEYIERKCTHRNCTVFRYVQLWVLFDKINTMTKKNTVYQKDPYEEMRFYKGQQYRIVYYALLLDAAIIALFQIETVISPNWVYIVIKVVSCTFMLFLGLFSHGYQNDTSVAIKQFRKHFEQTKFYNKKLDTFEEHLWPKKILFWKRNKHYSKGDLET